jgi:predicted metal-dependent hydrolase
MRPFKPILLTVPIRFPEKDALNYLVSKKPWILKTLPKIREMEKRFLAVQKDLLESHRKHIDLVHSDVKRVRIQPHGETIRVSIPLHVDSTDPLVEQAVSSGILLRMKNQALDVLPPRVSVLAGKFGFTFGKVNIKQMHTRWGSCTFRNDINLSVHLMNLPKHLVDYVILHELVHTVHKHHRKEFWQTLESVCPGARSYAQEIRNYRHLVLQ